MATIDTLIENALDELALAAQSDFNKTMQTWENHKSPVQIEKSAHRRVVFVDNEIYAYLNDGTSIRRAFLSRDHVNKTFPRVIESRSGKSGRVLRILPREKAFPGIKAREWDLTIVEHIESEVLPAVSEKLADNLVTFIVRAMR